MKGGLIPSGPLHSSVTVADLDRGMLSIPRRKLGHNGRA